MAECSESWCTGASGKGDPRKLVKVVEAIDHGATNAVRTKYGRTDKFSIKVGLHQGSALSTFLFTVLGVISQDVRVS